MSISSKIWLAIFTFFPVLLILIGFGFFFTCFLENIIELEHHHQNEFPFELMQSIFWFVAILIIAGLMSLGIKIYYIVHSIKNPENETTKKIMWTLILIFAGIIGSVVYYFIEIIPLKPENTLKESQ